MTLDAIELLAGAGALGAAGVALVAFLRTPAAQRMQLTTSAQRRKDQLLRERVARGECVEIAPQPVRALKRLVLWSAPVWPGLGLVLATQLGVELSCITLAGWNLAMALVLWMFWVLPLWVLAVCLAMAWGGWRGLRQGCFPPVESVQLVRVHGDRTWRGRIWATLNLAMPVLALWAVVLSVQAHHSLMAGRSISAVSEAWARQCTPGAAHRPGPR